MSTAAIIVAVATWQADPSVHPLTCGNDSGHRVLYGTELQGRVILVCPDCDYQQTIIPDVVLRRAGLG
jgi:hypothetical protein